ncbi:MAG: ribose-phosphate diphosphokinase, partial [Vicinamibacteria bacterium]
DLHAGQIQGFFNIPVDNLFATPVVLEYIKSNIAEKDPVVIVAPDAGGVERARAYAKRLNSPLAIIDKRRDQPNESHVVNIIGEVAGSVTVIVDDIVDTAGTLVLAAAALRKAGATSVYAAATHAVFSGESVKRITESVLTRVAVTDTIPLRGEATNCDKIVVLSVAELLSEAIKRIHTETSVSSLFV